MVRVAIVPEGYWTLVQAFAFCLRRAKRRNDVKK
jgi:hypothetical protein